MSFKIEKERTKTSPYVLIDEENCYMKLAGKSYLENITEFFKDINDWLEKYLSGDASMLTFDCAMEYFNSSTTKIIYNMLRRMDRAAGNGTNIVVNWIAAEDDEMIIECGEDFEEEMDHLTFNIVKIEE